jgi:hypothetical protein
MRIGTAPEPWNSLHSPNDPGISPLNRVEPGLCRLPCLVHVPGGILSFLLRWYQPPPGNSVPVPGVMAGNSCYRGGRSYIMLRIPDK